MSRHACKSLLGLATIVCAVITGIAVADENNLQPDDTVSEPDNSWIIQYHFGFASDADFGPSLLFLVDESEEHTKLHSLSIGKIVSNTFYGHDVDVSLHLGVQHFSERGFQADLTGTVAYWRLAKNTYLPYTRIPIKISLAQGLSYVSEVPTSEVRDFSPDESERLMHYLEYGLYYSFRNKLANNQTPLSPWFKDINLGYTIFHRSSVFGLFADTGGGINYPGFAVEFVLK